MSNKKPSYQDLEKQISELKAEIKLNNIENHFKMLVKASGDMITIHNTNGEYIYYSGPEYYEIEAKDVLGKLPKDLFNKDISTALTNAFQKVANTGKSETIEFFLEWLGVEKWVSEFIYPIKDENDQVIELVKVCKDISKEKEEKEKQFKELQNSKQKIQTTFKLLEKRNYSMEEASKVAKIGYWEHDVVNNKIIWSDYVHELFGSNPENGIPNQNEILENFTKKSQATFTKATLALLADGVEYDIELKYNHPQKKVIWLRNVAQAIYNKKGEVIGKRGILQNITILKQTQLKLELSKIKIQTSLNLLEKRDYSLKESSRIAKIGHWEYNIATDAFIWSDYVYEVYGFDLKENIPSRKEMVALYEKDSQEKLAQATLDLTSKRIPYDIELKLTNKKNEEIWVRNVVHLIYNDKNEIVGRRGVVHNITDSKKGQLALKRSKQKAEISFELLEKKEQALYEVSSIAKIGYWEYNYEAVNIIWSEYNYDIFGLDPKEGIPTRELILSFFDKKSQEKIELANRNLTTKGISYDIEVKLTNKKNEVIWLRNVVQPVYNKQNELLGRRGLLQNITDSKKAQFQLEHSKSKLQTSLELAEKKDYSLKEASKMAKVGHWEYDSIKDTLLWSEYVYHVFGYNPKDKPTPLKEHIKLFDEESIKKIKEGILDLTLKGNSYDIELRLINLKNEEVWVRSVAQPIYNKQNQVVGRRGVFHNITASKNAQFQLELSNRKLKASLELAEQKDFSLKEASRMAKIGHWEYTIATDTFLWSDYLHYIFGSDPREAIPSQEEILNNFCKESQQKIVEANLDLISKGIPYDIELKLVNLKKKELWIRNVVQPVFNKQNKVVGRRGVIQDITTTKRAQLELEFSKQKIQNTLELLEVSEYSRSEASKMAKIGYFEQDIVNNTRKWSEAIYEVFGFDPEYGIPPVEEVMVLFDEVSLKEITQAIQKLDFEGVPFDLELKINNKRNVIVWVRAVFEPIFNKLNKVVARRGVMQDITSSKKTQLELELSKNKLQALLEIAEKNDYALKEASKMAKIGYWEYDSINDIVTWSEYVYHIFGYNPKEVAPRLKEHLKLFVKESLKRLQDAILNLNLNGTPYDIELRLINNKNEEVWVRNVVQPVYNEENEIVGRRGVFHNITTSKKAQFELEFSKNKLQTSLELAKESEYLLKEAGRMANIGYWGYDKETDIISWSDSLHKIYGTDPIHGVPEIEVILSFFNEESRKKLVEATVAIATKGIPFEIELQLTNLQNEERWILNIGEAIFNEQNEIIGRRGVSQDITQRKLTQKVLDQKNEKLFELNNALNQAQKLTNVGSWQWNMITDKAEWSDEMYNIYGVTRENFYPSNKNVTKTVLPEDLYKVEQGVNSLLTGEIFIPFEFRIKRPSGEIRTLYIMALEKNSQESIFGVTKDITEQKLTEEKNLVIERNYRELFDNATVSIWNEDLTMVFELINELRKLNIQNISTYLEQRPEVVFSLHEKVIVNHVNKATLKLFKAKKIKDFLINIKATFGDGAEKVFEKLIVAIWNNDKTFTSEVNYRTLEGNQFAALVSIPIPQTVIEQKTVPVSIQSIQGIKEAELAKIESLNKLNEAQKLAKVGSWLYSTTRDQIEWSNETYRIYGFDPKKGLPEFDLRIGIIHKDYREFVLENVGKRTSFDIEYRVVLLNGEEKWIRAICKPAYNGKGELINLTGTIQDITEQKRISNEIEKAEEMYRLLADNSNDLICLHETNSTFIYISPSIKTLLGYEQSELIGKPGFNIIHKEDVLNFQKAIEKNVTNKTNNHSFIFRVIHKNGDILWFEFTASSVFKDNRIQLIMTSSRNVTNEVLAKERIQKYQTSLQKLTTEITLIEEKQKKEIATNIHDHLSQSLVISKMKINELKKNSQLKIISEDLQFIEKHISEALENSRKITYELSPPILYQLGLIDTLNWLLDNVEATHKITCVVNSNVSNVKLSDVKSILLFRSIQEVINNAIKYAKASSITLDLDKNKHGLTIFITDNGVGFDTSILNNLHNQSGSGFGLFTVQERIQNIQGKFTIKSKINVGTTVKFLIPLSK